MTTSRVDSLFKDVLARDEAGYSENMHEVSKIIVGDGPWVVWGRQDTVDVINKKFTGLEPDASGDGFGGWRLQNVALA
jgi:hypothetical protein